MFCMNVRATVDVFVFKIFKMELEEDFVDEQVYRGFNFFYEYRGRTTCENRSSVIKG